jgi:hypothetical protein
MANAEPKRWTHDEVRRQHTENATNHADTYRQLKSCRLQLHVYGDMYSHLTLFTSESHTSLRYKPLYLSMIHVMVVMSMPKSSSDAAMKAFGMFLNGGP